MISLLLCVSLIGCRLATEEPGKGRERKADESGGVAKTKPLSFFGTQAGGDHVVFCIDTGSNMLALAGPDGVAAVRHELKRVITEMPEETRFNIVCYGRCVDLFRPESLPAEAETKSEALRFFEGYLGGTGATFGRTRAEKFERTGKDASGISYTPVMPGDVKELSGIEGPNRIDLALASAFKLKPSTIFLVSAGVPRPKNTATGKELEPEEVLEAINAAAQAATEGNCRIPVNTTSIHSDTLDGTEGRKFLGKLAAKYGGKHRDVRPQKVKSPAPAGKGAQRA